MQLRAIAFKLPTPGGNPHDFSLGGREICIINIQVGCNQNQFSVCGRKDPSDFERNVSSSNFSHVKCHSGYKHCTTTISVSVLEKIVLWASYRGIKLELPPFSAELLNLYNPNTVNFALLTVQFPLEILILG